MKKVLILSISDKRHMSMISPYIEYLKQNNICYDIIRTNRYDISKENDYIIEHPLGKIYELKMIFDPGVNKLKKVLPFLSFRRNAIKIIKKEKYDYIIVWNENTAVIFFNLLSGSYKGKYCVNVRDLVNHQSVVQRILFLALKKAHFTTIPSPEAAQYFPVETICLYNRDLELLKSCPARESFRENNLPIRITHLGFYHKTKKAANALADLFGNDNRFELYFYGNGFDTDFQKIITEKGYNNIITGGAFPYEETAKYLSQTDIINSYYNRFEHPSLRVSFGVKHSYTPLLYIPGLADEDTCWGRLSRPYGLAYLVNDNNLKTLPNDLYLWYRQLDFDEFKKSCDTFNDVITKSLCEMEKKLDTILR